MKLKVISTNGYYIFVDEHAEIKANNYFYNTITEEIVFATPERITWIKDKERKSICFKVFFTDRKIYLNPKFEIHTLVDWKTWDIHNAADKYSKSFINYENNMEEHFIKGCEYMRDMYPSRVYPKYVEVADRVWNEELIPDISYITPELHRTTSGDLMGTITKLIWE